MDNLSPDISGGCPFKHPINLTKWEFNEVFSKYFPTIFPDGDFQIRHRVHKKDNTTVMRAKFNFQARASGLTESIKLG